MKKISIKAIITINLAIALTFGIVPLSAYAANNDMHLILGVGRSFAVVQNSSGVKIESLEKTANPRNIFCVPIVDSGSTYVPFRYIMETAGFTVEHESATNTTVLQWRSGGSFPLWIEDSVRGARKVNATRVDYKDDVFTVIVENSRDTEKIQIAQSKTYFGRTYIPIRELERFEFIVHWDGTNSAVHIISGTSNGFKTDFEAIFKEKDATLKRASASTYFNKMTKTDDYYEAIEKLLSPGTEYGNYSNNSLALRTPDGLFMSTIKDSKNDEYAAVSTGSRQLTYTTANNKKCIYYISKTDKQIYKVEVTGKDRIGTPAKVTMPKELAGKKFSQLIINHDRLFFIAYDNAKEGGYAYMAQVGDEEKSTVKLTKTKVWNIALTPDYRLYYTNFEKDCALYFIDLKGINNLTAMYNDKNIGLEGRLRQNVRIQSFALSQKTPDTYYYSDVSTGAIMEATITSGNVTTKQIIKSANSNSLFNFLNLYEASDDKVLYYIEYANGRLNNFDSCRIMAYNLYTNKTEEVYQTSSMIMQLTIVGKSIYFTNNDYSKLYKVDVTDSGYVYTEF